MNEATQTLEGWYVLHDFRSIDWGALKQLSPDEQSKTEEEITAMFAEWAETENNMLGCTVVYSIVGQKADFVLMHMRESLQELNALETRFNKSHFAQSTYPAHSYVSVVELSNYLAYMAKPDADPLENPQIVARLKPIPPKSEHFCFYPMNKKREGADNWYMMSMEERRDLMRSHGLIGRSYAGKVKQIISGSIGFDDWEWGVTLFADDPLQFKKLIYEMRFDEASARFAEFGEFFVGNRLEAETLIQMLQV